MSNPQLRSYRRSITDDLPVYSTAASEFDFILLNYFPNTFMYQIYILKKPKPFLLKNNHIV